MRKIDTLDYMLDSIETLIQRIPDNNEYKDELLSKYNNYRTMFESNPNDSNVRYFVFKYLTELEAYVKGYSIQPPVADYEKFPVLLVDDEEDFSDISNLNDYVDILANSIDNIDQITDSKSLSTLTNHVQQEYALVKLKKQMLDQKICRALFKLMLMHIRNNEIEEAKKVAEKFDLDMRIYLVNYLKPKIDSLKQEKRFTEAEFIWKFVYGPKPIRTNDMELWLFIAKLENIDFIPANNVSEDLNEKHEIIRIKKKLSLIDVILNLAFLIKSNIKRLIIRNDNGNCNKNDLLKALDLICSKKGNQRYELAYSEGIKEIKFLQEYTQSRFFDRLVSVIIPKSAEKILPNSFKNCVGLRTVYMQKSNIVDIGSFAFFNTPLTDVKFPNSLVSIGDYAFSQCQDLSVVDLRTTKCELLGNGAFRQSGIEKIDFSYYLKTINPFCFADTQILDRVSFMSTLLTSIGDKAFSKSKIREVIFNSRLSTIGNGAFENTIYLNAVSLKDTLITELNTRVFSNSYIKSIEMPKSLETIGEYAFYNCRNLEQVNLLDTNVTIIKDMAFSLSKLSVLILPNTLREINPRALEFTYNLKYINLSFTSIETIKPNTFKNSNINCVIFNDKIKKIERPAFYKCSKLSRIDLSRCTQENFENLLDDLFYIALSNNKSINIVSDSNSDKQNIEKFVNGSKGKIEVIKPSSLKSVNYKKKFI